MSHAHVIVQRVPVSLPWAWNSLLMSTTTKPSKVLGPVQQPKGPCFVAGCYRSPLSRNGQPVSGELYNKMSQSACFHGHPAWLHLPCWHPTQHLSVLHIDSTKNIFKENNVILRHMAYRIMHIISYISYLTNPKKICPFPTASEHCPHLHCQLFL